jgi:hypothetical protein
LVAGYELATFVVGTEPLDPLCSGSTRLSQFLARTRLAGSGGKLIACAASDQIVTTVG